MSQDNETPAMLVDQANPVDVPLSSYANAFIRFQNDQRICSNEGYYSEKKKQKEHFDTC